MSADDPRFRAAYAAHRAREGRGPLGERDLLDLPFLRRGPFAAEWAVRARSFRAFCAGVLEPLRERLGRPLDILDLGAGNGWLSARVCRMGHRALALDARSDRVDGLGAAAAFAAHLPRMFGRVAGSFERLPFRSGTFDLAVFNASLHYALDLSRVLGEVTRVVRAGGRLAILDSPFYPTEAAGAAMAEEKRARASALFGEHAAVLASPAFVEYLTRGRLGAASRAPGTGWRRIRVRYPWRYEVRPVVAALRGRRPPSRFDVWWTEVG